MEYTQAIDKDFKPHLFIPQKFKYVLWQTTEHKSPSLQLAHADTHFPLCQKVKSR